MARNKVWETQTKPSVEHIQMHVQKPGILVGKDGLSGVVIKGIGSDMPIAQVKQNLIAGNPRIQQPQDVLISQSLANQLKVKLNGSLILYFLSQPNRPRKVQITGIYETGLEEMDKLFVLADRTWVQEMNQWTSDSIGTYEVYLNKPVQTQVAAQTLLKTLPADWKLETSEEIYPALYDWMHMLDRNIVIFISLLLIVACFNLIATLWVLIMERIPMIGLLKSLGAPAQQIRSIFWWNGFFILIRGLVLGNILAVLFCYVQYTYHLIPLDPANYYMSAVPIQWNSLVWMYVNVGTCLLVSIIIYIPTHFSQKIEVKDALDYKR